MSFEERTLLEKDLISLFALEENHFNDFKSKDIEGKKLSRTISAFANASGGDIYIGIEKKMTLRLSTGKDLNQLKMLMDLYK